MADSDIVEILQSQRENKTRANTAIKKLSRAKVKQKKILRFNRAIAASEECAFVPPKRHIPVFPFKHPFKPAI